MYLVVLLHHLLHTYLPMLFLMQEPAVDPQNQTPVTGYTLSYKESSAADFIAVSHPDSITSYLIPNTEFGKTYSVKATASNDGGPSAETDAVSISKLTLF